MLFHVTMSHTVDNCPIYHQDSKGMMPKMIEATEGLERMAEELNVKIHFLTSNSPEHIFSHCLKQRACPQ